MTLTKIKRKQIETCRDAIFFPVCRHNLTLTQVSLVEVQGDIGDIAHDEVGRFTERHQEVIDRLLDTAHDVENQLRVLDGVIVRSERPVGVGEGPVDEGAVVGVVVEAEAVLDGPGVGAVDHGIALDRGDRVAAYKNKNRNVQSEFSNYWKRRQTVNNCFANIHLDSNIQLPATFTMINVRAISYY